MDAEFSVFIEDMVERLINSRLVPDAGISSLVGGTVAQLLLEKSYEDAD